MSKYDKELDTRTEEYEEAIEPLDRELGRNDAPRPPDSDGDENGEDGGTER